MDGTRSTFRKFAVWQTVADGRAGKGDVNDITGRPPACSFCLATKTAGDT